MNSSKLVLSILGGAIALVSLPTVALALPKIDLIENGRYGGKVLASTLTADRECP